MIVTVVHLHCTLLYHRGDVVHIKEKGKAEHPNASHPLVALDDFKKCLPPPPILAPCAHPLHFVRAL